MKRSQAVLGVAEESEAVKNSLERALMKQVSQANSDDKVDQLQPKALFSELLLKLDEFYKLHLQEHLDCFGSEDDREVKMWNSAWKSYIKAMITFCDEELTDFKGFPEDSGHVTILKALSLKLRCIAHVSKPRCFHSMLTPMPLLTPTFMADLIQVLTKDNLAFSLVSALAQ